MSDHRTGNKQEKKRDAKGKFVKGVSGNPGGRPKMDEDIKALLLPLVPKSIAVMQDILANPESADRDKIRVAETVLDRVYGKANQAIELDSDSSMTIMIEGCEDYAD